MTISKPRFFVNATGILCVLYGTMAYAGNEFERASLEGVTAMRVIVEKFDAEAKALGVNHHTLKTAAELRLRRSGIKVRDTALTVLYINVNLIPMLDGKLVVFHARVAFHQQATLLINKKSQTVITWDQSTTGGMGKEDMHHVRRVVDDKVDEFINDYLAANQKNLKTGTIDNSQTIPHADFQNLTTDTPRRSSRERLG